MIHGLVKFPTIKRAIVIWQNNNKQVKLLPLRLDFSHGIMVTSFQDSLHLIRTSTQWWKHRFRIKCLDTHHIQKLMEPNNITCFYIDKDRSLSTIPCQKCNTFAQVHSKTHGLHCLAHSSRN